MAKENPKSETRNPKSADSPELSLVIPVYNEEGNVEPLHRMIREALDDYGRSFEMVFVDDGSTDGTAAALAEIAGEDRRVKVVTFRKNFGQTAAMSAGIDHAAGGVIIPMDGDCQNDPRDIPRLVAKLEEGYDVVSGWRKDRQDKPFSRRLPSVIANRIISRASGVHLHDYGCSLKAYRREVIKDVRLYGEMHRFIPIYATWQGARVAELPVAHHARTRGKSKYGINRTIKVLLDLVVVMFFQGFGTKPIYMFGGFGFLSWLLAFFVGLLMLYFKLFGGKDFVETPLPNLFVLLTLGGFLSILMGLLAELVMRTYYESQQKPTYLVKEVLGLEAEDCRLPIDDSRLKEEETGDSQASSLKTQD